MATPAALRLGVPVLAAVIPPKYHHWIPVMIKNSVRFGAISIAWRLQVVNSAIQSALRGGLLFSRSLLRWAVSRKMTSLSHEETYADEVAGYSIAAL
jgi:cobalamin biosynthesis protein CobD/CbiB